MFFRIYLLDLYQDDSYLDLFIHTVSESDCASNAFFVQYNESELSQNMDFNIADLAKDFNIYRYSLVSTDGKGNFTLSIDTPIYSPSIGCYYCYVSFQMKDSKISMIPAGTFTLSEYSAAYRYKAAKAFSAYKSAGSKTAAYKLKKGVDQVRP